MQIEERRRLELRSRQLEAEMRSDMVRATHLQNDLVKNSKCIKDNRSEFEKIKANFANIAKACSTNCLHTVVHNAKSLQHKLKANSKEYNKLNAITARIEKDRSALHVKTKSTKDRIDKIKEKISVLNVKEKEETNQRELDEILEIKSYYTDTDSVAVEPDTTPKSNNASTSNDNTREPSQYHNSEQPKQQADCVDRGEHSFRQTRDLDIPQGVEINSLESWVGLKGTGVNFVLQTHTGRKLEVTIQSLGEQAVRVNITSTNERDRRVLWQEKREILAALKAKGYSVKDFWIRGISI